MTIINLTNHRATAEQREAGVRDVSDVDHLSNLLTIKVGGENGFATISPLNQQVLLESRAAAIISDYVTPVALDKVQEFKLSGDRIADYNAIRSAQSVTCMVGGFPPLVEELVRQLRRLGHEPMYALSDRVSVEETLEDGSIRKTQVFKHLGFYPAR